MSFSAPSRDRNPPVLPLASMVDIMFLLLIFFLTTAAFREQERQMDVDLPAAENSSGASSRTQVVITVTEDGTIYMGDRTYTLAALKQTLGKLAKQFPDEAVIIRGDSGSRFGQAIAVADIVYASGLRHVSFATIRKRSEL